MEVIRNDEPYGKRVYKTMAGGAQLIKDQTVVKVIPGPEIDKATKILLKAITDNDSNSRSFRIPEIENFLKVIWIDKIKADTKHKEDIVLKFHDVRSDMTPVVGFSIKSFIGGDPTLLNASEATNFRFKIEGCTDELMHQVNNINTGNKIKTRIATIKSAGCTINYLRCPNEKFDRNLRILDSDIGRIIGEMLYRSYSGERLNRLSEIVDDLERCDPFDQKISGWYRFKVKQLLSRVALGMTPTADWKGEEGSNGGYIVVKEDGSIVCFFFYDRSVFEEYLLNHTKFERGSTSRHKYATIYKDPKDGYCIDFNLQIRFTSPQNNHRTLEQLTLE